MATLALPLAASADKVMYRIVGPDGKVTFTDKKPAGDVKYEVLTLRASDPPAAAKPRQRSWSLEPTETAPVFAATGPFASPHQTTT